MVHNELERFWVPDNGRRGGYLFFMLILSKKEVCDLWNLHLAFVLNLGPNLKFLISRNLQKLAQIETQWLLQANLLNIRHYLKIYKNWTQVDTLTLAIHSFTCFSQQLFVLCIHMSGIAWACITHLYFKHSHGNLWTRL